MSYIEEQIHNFDKVERVIANDEKFKARVGLGAGGYTSLKLADLTSHLYGLHGVVGTGATVGSNVATWFLPKGLTALLTLNPASPIPYIIGGSVAAGGLYCGVIWLYRSYYEGRVDEIPRFLNTPVDILGASFLDLVGSLAIKVASIDGHIHERERKVIADYFVEEWGYDRAYTTRALDLLEETTEQQRVSEMAATLAEFARTNPDCDFSKIQQGLSALLTEIAEADGKIDEREEMAIERIIAALEQENSTYSSIKRVAAVPITGLSSATGWVRGKLFQGVSSE